MDLPNLTYSEAKRYADRWRAAQAAEPHLEVCEVTVEWWPELEDLGRGDLIKIGEDIYTFLSLARTVVDEHGIRSTLQLTPFAAPINPGTEGL